jgi:hypothetical protein
MTTLDRMQTVGIALTCVLTIPFLGALMFGWVGAAIGLGAGLGLAQKSMAKLNADWQERHGKGPEA